MLESAEKWWWPHQKLCKVWKDKRGRWRSIRKPRKIWWWLKGSSFIGWWSIWKMEAKVVEVGGKIISSVYIDEKSKSPEKLSSICYMSQCWHSSWKRWAFPNQRKAMLHSDAIFSLLNLIFSFPPHTANARARLPNKIGRLTFLLQSVLKGFVL